MSQSVIIQPNLLKTRASAEIAAHESCFICKAQIIRRQILMRVPGPRFVHFGICWHKYIARMAVVYDLKAADLIRDFKVSMRTARRILALRKEDDKW